MYLEILNGRLRFYGASLRYFPRHLSIREVDVNMVSEMLNKFIEYITLSKQPLDDVLISIHWKIYCWNVAVKENQSINQSMDG